jgi:hypothetical protein
VRDILGERALLPHKPWLMPLFTLRIELQDWRDAGALPTDTTQWRQLLAELARASKPELGLARGVMLQGLEAALDLASGDPTSAGYHADECARLAHALQLQQPSAITLGPLVTVVELAAFVHSRAGDLAGLELDVAFLEYVADRLALANGAVERCKLLRDSKKQQQAPTPAIELPSSGVFSPGLFKVFSLDQPATTPALPSFLPEAGEEWPECWDSNLPMEDPHAKVAESVCI